MNACRDKCVKIVCIPLGKIFQFTQKLWQFYPQLLTIPPSEGLLFLYLYCQMVPRIIQNLQQKWLNMGLTPLPLLSNVKKTDYLVPWSVPNPDVIWMYDFAPEHGGDSALQFSLNTPTPPHPFVNEISESHVFLYKWANLPPGRVVLINWHCQEN